MMKYITAVVFFSLFLNGKAQIISTVAGSGNPGFSGIGDLAVNANLEQPWDVDIDSQGNIYFSDQINAVVFKVDTVTGILTNILGNGTSGQGNSGELGPDYELTIPGFIHIDQTNNDLYVADYGVHKILKMNLQDSVVQVVAGTGTAGISPDGSIAQSSAIDLPMGISIGTDGDLYFVEYNNYVIRKIKSDGTLQTVAGIPSVSGSVDGSLSSATLGSVFGMEIDANNHIYIAEAADHKIRKIDLVDGLISTVCGTGTAGYNGDGLSGVNTQLNAPHSLGIDPQGNLIIGDVNNHRIRKLDLSTQLVSTIAGTGIAGYSGDGGDPLLADINGPLGVHVLQNGDLFFTDIDAHVVRKIKNCQKATAPSLLVINDFLDSTVFCEGNYEILVSDGDLNDSQDWFWYEDSCGNENPVATGLIHEHYLDETISFFVRGEGGCADPGPCQKITLTFSECKDTTLISSTDHVTAFSPNNDGVNDYLVIPQVENFPQNQVVIYNRWGDVIRKFKNYDNLLNNWDGTNQVGRIVGVGTYFYIFESENIQYANWIQVVK
ncbi:MAG: gliding motility-associated C-terminal domain-containing protein [Crocinitomicaceae bacterium]